MHTPKVLMRESWIMSSWLIQTACLRILFPYLVPTWSCPQENSHQIWICEAIAVTLWRLSAKKGSREIDAEVLMAPSALLTLLYSEFFSSSWPLILLEPQLSTLTTLDHELTRTVTEESLLHSTLQPTPATRWSLFPDILKLLT